jgi:hypothetical protein
MSSINISASKSYDPYKCSLLSNNCADILKDVQSLLIKFEIPFQLEILKKMKTDELYKLKKNIQKYKHLFFLRDKF